MCSYTIEDVAWLDEMRAAMGDKAFLDSIRLWMLLDKRQPSELARQMVGLEVCDERG